MTAETLHIVFTPSGAGTLREALIAEGRTDGVVSLFDDLSFGPIASSDHSDRPMWVEQQLGHTDWDDVLAKSEPFWRESLSPDPRKVVWMSRRHAADYAGFLEWLWRAGEMPCDIIDLTEHKVSRRPFDGPLAPAFAISLAGLLPEEIGNSRLFERSEALQASERHRYHEIWRRLRAENAPFRITDGHDLRSAPVTVFDQMLRSHVVDQWRKVARVVGESLGGQFDEQLHQTNDLVLAGRINALVNSDILECQGDSPLNMRLSEVRLPQRANSRLD